MKSLLYILFITLPFIACKKADTARHFTITAIKADSVLAVLEIDKAQYSFTGTTTQKDIVVEGGSSVMATLSSSSPVQLTLDLTENGNYIGRAYGSSYIYMIVNSSGIGSYSATTPPAGNGSGGSSGGGGSSCSSVQCSASTQSGSRCKRTTTNCNGRCWQHQ